MLIIVFCIVSLLVFSCSHRKLNSSSEGACYIIELDENKEEYMPYSSVFKNMQTIIIETNNDCLIGRINELQVYNDYIYILDMLIAKSLFVFDKEGHFVRKIGNLGRGPGEYIQIEDFSIDKEKGIIYLLDFGQRVHKYRLDGTYLNTITVQIQRSTVYFIQFYNNRLYASVRSWEPSPDDFLLVEIDPDNGKILSQHLPSTYNKGWSKSSTTGHSFFISRLNNPPRYTHLFMDTIVSLGEEITPYIELKSKHLVTNEDFENLPEEKLTTFTPFQVLQGTSKIWDVNSFLENDDIIFFRCKSGFMSGNRSSFSVLFHKKNGSVKIANRMFNDFLFKRIDDDEKSIMYVFDGKFAFSDSKGAYEILNSQLIESFKESIRNNELVPDLDKLDELLNLEEDANPVIFYYEYK